MKKILSFALLSAVAVTASAEVYLDEVFPYPASSLNSQGIWVTNGVSGSYPINVVNEQLTLAGYRDEPSGNAVRIDMSMGKNSLQNIIRPSDRQALSGAVFYSALVRVDEFPSSLGKPGAILSLTGENEYSGEYGDSFVSSEGAGLFVKKGSADDKAVFGVSRRSSSNGVNASDVEWSTREITAGETALIVVCYEQLAGTADDVVRLWVNPAAEMPEADASQDATSTVEESLTAPRGIAINQRSALTSKMPQVTIDAIRVASSWDDIFTTAGEPVTVPNITISENPVDFGQVYCGVPTERTVTIKATDLEGDITVRPGETGLVAVSDATIPADRAMTDEGFPLTLTLTAEEGRYYSDRIVLESPGAQNKVISVEWHAVPSLVASTLRELCDESTHDMTSVYVYSGQATVTFIESYYDASYDRVVNSIFCQDETAGVELRSATGCGYQEIDITGVEVGDNLTNIAGYLIFGDSGLTMVPRTAAEWQIASRGNVVEPETLTLREIAQATDGYVYCNRLVRVEHVTYPDEYLEAGDYFGLWNSQKYKIFDGTLDDYDSAAWMWCNKGADYFKTSTEGYFDHIWTLTGIINNYYPIHLSPRGFSDFNSEGPKENSIGSIEATADDKAEYYTTQGVRTANPEKGIYIVRHADGTVSRVVYK